MAGKNRRRRRNSDDRDLLLRLSVGIGAIVLIAGVIWVVSSFLNPKVDITEGRSLLNKLNGAPVSTIKAEIKELEKSEAEARDSRKKQPHATRFANAVIIGDGSVKGLSDYCNLSRVLAVQNAEVSGVIADATASLSVQSSKSESARQPQKTNEDKKDTENQDGSEEEPQEDGVHNNYGIEGNQSREKIYSGEELTLDTTYGGETNQDDYYYDPYAETTEDTTEQSPETTADQTVNSQMITAIKANPSKLFLAYGYNDIATTKGDVSKFIESYRTVLSNLKEKLPECNIYVLSILPVRKNVLDENKAYESLDSYNKELAALCREMHITFIDNTDLVNSDDYAEDGVSFTESFYSRMLERLEEIGDL